MVQPEITQIAFAGEQ